MDNNYIFQYWEAIQNGTVTVGKWIRTIYKILVDGLKSGKWDYDEGKAEKAIKFIENFCHHSEGRNDLLKLEPVSYTHLSRIGKCKVYLYPGI